MRVLIAGRIARSENRKCFLDEIPAIEVSSNWTGKTAVVTGAVGILGERFCRGLAEFGAQVAVVDLDPRAMYCIRGGV